jgi:Uncharacterized protein conserved in bacteria (DUF2188)
MASRIAPQCSGGCSPWQESCSLGLNFRGEAVYSLQLNYVVASSEQLQAWLGRRKLLSKETNMTKKDYHVVPHENGWAVKREGAERASSIHRTQGEAIEEGRRLAQSGHTELVVHRPNGQIRDTDSYGHDPVPPKDTKH